MELTIFYGYRDTKPKEISLEEIVQRIKGDEQLRNLTEKHRYYLSLNLKDDAQRWKESCPCFAVAARFSNGKDTANITELTFIGMAEADHVPEHLLPDLRRKAREDPHTLLDYTSIGKHGFHLLYLYVIRNLSELDGVSFSHLYGAAFDWGNRYYADLLGVPMDSKCRKVTQLSGLAHDPEVYFNPDALPFDIEVEKPQATARQHHASLSTAVRAAKKLLAEEGITFRKGMRNNFLMRMGYLLNSFGVPQDDATDWAIGKFASKYEGDILGIFQSCYQKKEEHGSRPLPKKVPKEENRWASVTEIEEFLHSQASVRFNVIRRQCEISWKNQVDATEILRSALNDKNNSLNDNYLPITDRDENTLWCRMKKNGTEVRLQDIRNVLQSEFVPAFHPFEDYFGSLPEWDGVDYIGQLAGTVQVKGDQERFVEHFRKWFVGILPTIFDDQVVNHEIMVFIGKQGNFKSTFFSLLLPPALQSYFHVKMNSSHLNKDDMLTLCEKALVCLEEIDELRPSELNQLKALVTAKNISERAAYARNKEHRPHIASFCGTGNNPHFLSDPTDNRRWIVVEVEDIVNPWLHPFNYTGIYSQALALWKSGFRYWFNQDEIRLLNEQNREYQVPLPEEELLLTYFRPTFPGCQGSIFMKVSEILERINVGVKQQLSPNKLGMLLTKLGFQKARYNNERGYLVIERSVDEISASRKLAAQNLLEV